jgi:hypothetical protein
MSAPAVRLETTGEGESSLGLFPRGNLGTFSVGAHQIVEEGCFGFYRDQRAIFLAHLLDRSLPCIPGEGGLCRNVLSRVTLQALSYGVLGTRVCSEGGRLRWQNDFQRLGQRCQGAKGKAQKGAPDRAAASFVGVVHAGLRSDGRFASAL